MPCNHRRQRLVAVFAASFLLAEPYVAIAQDTRLNELLQSRSQIPSVPADLGRLNLTAVEHLLSSPRTTETAAAITAMADTLFNVHANRLPSESLVVSHFDEVYERALRYQPAEQRELAIGALKSGLTLLGKAQTGTVGVADVPAALDFGTGAYRLHQQLFMPNSAGPTSLIPRDVVTLKLLVLLHPDQAAPLLQRWLGGNGLRLDILEYSALVDSFPPSQRVLAEMLREASAPRSSRAAVETRLAEAQASIGELAIGLADVRNSLGRLVEEAKTERSRKELSARVYGAIDALEAVAMAATPRDATLAPVLQVLRGSANAALAFASMDYVGMTFSLIQVFATAFVSRESEPSSDEQLSLQMARFEQRMTKVLQAIGTQLTAVRLDSRDLSQLIINVHEALVQVTAALRDQISRYGDLSLRSLKSVEDSLRATHLSTLEQAWVRLESRAQSYSLALAEGEPATFRNARANLDEAASAVEVHLRPDATGLMHPAFVGSESCLSTLSRDQALNARLLSEIAKMVRADILTNRADSYARCFSEIVELIRPFTPSITNDPMIPNAGPSLSMVAGSDLVPHAGLMAYHLSKIRIVAASLPPSEAREKLVSRLTAVLSPSFSYLTFLTTGAGYDVIERAYNSLLTRTVDAAVSLTNNPFIGEVRRFDEWRREIAAHWASLDGFSKAGPYFDHFEKMTYGLDGFSSDSAVTEWRMDELRRPLERVLQTETSHLTSSVQYFRPCNQSDSEKTSEQCQIEYTIKFEDIVKSFLKVLNEDHARTLEVAFDAYLTRVHGRTAQAIAASIENDLVLAAFLEGFVAANSQFIAASQSVDVSVETGIVASGILDRAFKWLQAVSKGEQSVPRATLTQWAYEQNSIDEKNPGRFGNNPEMINRIRQWKFPVARYDTIPAFVTFSAYKNSDDDPRLKLPEVRSDLGEAFYIPVHWLAKKPAWLNEYRCLDCAVDFRRERGSVSRLLAIAWSTKEHTSEWKSATDDLSNWTVNRTVDAQGGISSVSILTKDSAQSTTTRLLQNPVNWKSTGGLAHDRGISIGGVSLAKVALETFLLAYQERKADDDLKMIRNALANPVELRSIVAQAAATVRTQRER